MEKRKGRIYKVKKFPSFNVDAGVLDVTAPKSIFYIISGHFTTEEEHPKTQIRSFIYQVKRIIEKQLLDSPFIKNYILTPHYPDTFIDTSKCFVKVELTLFYKKEQIINPIEWVDRCSHFLEEYLNGVKTFTLTNKKKGRRNKL